jgi:PAS domain S-box-containing protein
VRIGFDGYLRRVNPAWAVLGWSEEELLGRPWAAFLIHPDDLARTEAAAAAMAHGSAVLEFEQRLMCKDGSWRWFSCSGRPRAEDRCFYGVGIDITERKLAEESVARLNRELAAANRELEAFSYSVSHDLRTPLRAMDGYSRILLEEHADALGSEAREYLEGVRANALRMGTLIDDLLAFSRLTRQPVHREQVDTANLVRQVLRDLRHEREGRSVDVRVAQLPGCSADPALLRQVYSNLLSNALKYTRRREAAVVEVGADEQDGGRCSTSGTTAWASTCGTSASCSASSSACTGPTSTRGPAWAWRSCSASCTATGGACGRRPP